jgi:phytoene dehydrogenase-like protein
MLKSDANFVILEGMHKPQAIIIGSGLSGLVCAAHAQKNGFSVEIVESRDIPGGLLKRNEVGGIPVPTGLEFLPVEEQTPSLLSELNDLLGQDVGFQAETTQPLTFDAGKLKSFIGFGTHASTAVEEFNRLNIAVRGTTQLASEDWIEILLQKVDPAKIHCRQSVTALHIENGRCTGVEINGSKVLSAESIIYAGPESELQRLLPEALLHQKARNKISKIKSFTSVSLHFVHRAPVTTDLAYHFLGGADALLLVGRFFATDPQTSSWLALLPEEESDDESVGQALRSMKRQIKRPYPEALNDLIAEKIVIGPQSHGSPIFPLRPPGLLADVENLMIASSRSSNSGGLLASLERGFAAAKWLSDHIRSTMASPEATL